MSIESYPELIDVGCIGSGEVGSNLYSKLPSRSSVESAQWFLSLILTLPPSVSLRQIAGLQPGLLPT
jgi:hypothetical protein